MRLIRAKNTRAYALEAAQLERKIQRLRASLKDAQLRHDEIQTYLGKKHPEGFHLADDQGYLMEGVFTPHERQDVDLAKVAKFYAKHGKTMPRKKVSWIKMIVRHVLVSDEE